MNKRVIAEYSNAAGLWRYTVYVTEGNHIRIVARSDYRYTDDLEAKGAGRKVAK